MNYRRPTVPNPALDDYWWNIKSDRPDYYRQYIRVKGSSPGEFPMLFLNALMDGRWRQHYKTTFFGAVRIVGYSDALDAFYDLTDAGVAGSWGYVK